MQAPRNSCSSATRVPRLGRAVAGEVVAGLDAQSAEQVRDLLASLAVMTGACGRRDARGY